MKAKLRARAQLRFLIALNLALAIPATVLAQNTMFTYQGRVQVNGTNFNGTGTFRFALVTSTNFNHQATGVANMGGVSPNFFVSSCSVTFGGNGYTSPPAVSITGGGGSGATAQANLGNGLNAGTVVSITVLTPGSGYSSTPLVTIAPPPPNVSYVTYWSNDGTSVSGSEPSAGVTLGVANGLMMVVLGDNSILNMDFISASVFAQPNLQLRIWFNDGVHGDLALDPPQNLTATPYAAQALNAELAQSVAGTNITGTIPYSALQSGIVTNNQTGVNLNGSFIGNGNGLSNLSATGIAFGTTNLSITAWGQNSHNQTTIPTGIVNAIAVSAGIDHGLALKSDGTVAAWGAGMVYNPSNFYDLGQSIVPAGLSNVVAIAAGGLHSLALKANGTVVAWGAGTTNNPGDGNDFGQSIVPGGLSSVKAIAGGATHSLALLTNGTVVAWGAGTSNNPSDGYDFGQAQVPTGLSNVTAISAGYLHSLALKSDGTVVAWGAGKTNNPSDNSDFGQSIVPTGLNNVVAIAAGGLHSLALKANGNVVAWGAGTSNNPSDGIDFGQSIVPSGLNNVVSISAGILTSYALKSDGTIVAWGDDLEGETNVPAGLNNIVAISPAGCARFMLGLRKQASGPLAFLDSDNTFDGNIQVNGSLTASGPITSGTGFYVNGTNQYYVPGAAESLRIVRGSIESTGAIYNGTGFTVSHTSTGNYLVTFNPGFSAFPVGTASPSGFPLAIMLFNPQGNNQALISAYSLQGSLTNTGFNFIASGPQ